MFGGGMNELFFIDKLDKGVKEYIIETERQKDIRANIKASKNSIKDFNKQRKKHLKTLQEMYRSVDTTAQEFTDFFDALRNERLEFQKLFISDRLAVVEKINPGEWDDIIQFSDKAVDKRQQKAEKKVAKAEAKGEQGFDKTRKSIANGVTDTNRQRALLAGLNGIQDEILGLSKQIEEINTTENEILVRRNASAGELQQIADDLNKLRDHSFDQLLDFRQLMMDNTSDKEWPKVARAFSKELELTAH